MPKRGATSEVVVVRKKVQARKGGAISAVRKMEAAESAAKRATATRRLANIRTGGTLHIEKKTQDLLFANLVGGGPLVGQVWQHISPAGLAIGQPACCNAVSEGIAVNQRIGNRIQLESLQIRGYVSWSVADPGSGDDPFPKPVRLRLILDKQANGDPPTANDIFRELVPADITGYVAAGEALAFFQSVRPNNVSTTLRFHTLRDWVVEPPDTVGTLGPGTGGIMKEFDIFVPLHGLVTSFQDSGAVTASIADITDHSITLWACPFDTSGVGQVRGSVRLRYTDV